MIGEGIYTAEDFKKELMDLYTGKTISPRRWEHNMYEFNKLTEFQKRKEIQISYDLMMPYILKNKNCYVNPYIIDWSQYLNENEQSVFIACRAIGIPFYPQFQVGKYYLDFANPWKKIGLEVDSKTYHTIEKDIARDLELKALGWKMYHVSSAEAYPNSRQNMVDRDMEFSDDYDGLRYNEYLSNSLFGIIECIHFIEFNGWMPENSKITARKVTQDHLLIK